MTILTVIKPGDGLEIRQCIVSFRKHARDGFDWAFATERCHLAKTREMLPDERVVEMPWRAETISRGYFRQMAAKLLCSEIISDPQIVITDDDTEAIASWGVDTFFCDDRARIYYEPTPYHAWKRGSALIFARRSVRNWQLRLPLAIRRETLLGLLASPIASGCLAAWRNDQWASEFDAMGEFAWQSQDEHALFVNNYREHSHWATGTRPAFRDWQRNRKGFRKAIKSRLTK